MLKTQTRIQMERIFRGERQNDREGLAARLRLNRRDNFEFG
jgi:hypothetical protein